MQELKFTEIMTLASIVDVQFTTIEESVKTLTDENEIKVMKSELTKLKPIKTKLKKMMADY